MTMTCSILSTETVNYWVQIYSSAGDCWRDCWKHESMEEAEKNLMSALTAYTEAEYRIVKRRIIDEVC